MNENKNDTLIKLMYEFQERAKFMADFNNYLKNITKNYEISADYLVDYLNLPFIYNKKSIHDIFGSIIHIIIYHTDDINEDTQMNILYNAFMTSKISKTKFYNFKINKIAKTDKNILINFNYNKAEPIFINIISVKHFIPTNSILLSNHSIETNGYNFFNIMTNNKIFEYNFNNITKLNDLLLNWEIRKTFYTDFIYNLININYVCDDYDLVSHDLLPVIFKETNTICDITNIKPPYINIHIDCKCYNNDGRNISIMALMGIVNNINADDNGKCPYCKSELKIALKKKLPNSSKFDIKNTKIDNVFENKLYNNFNKDAVNFINDNIVANDTQNNINVIFELDVESDNDNNSQN